MKKLISTVLTAALLMALLVSCGNPQSGGNKDGSADGKAEAAAEATESAGTDDTSKIGLDNYEMKGLNIAIVTSPSGVDDGSFNQNIYEGIQMFIQMSPESKVTHLREETGDVAKCLEMVQDIVADYDVIVCCGFQFAGIGDIAQNSPDVRFILVDTSPTDAEGNVVELDNLYSMTFKEEEGGFCAGVAAALATKTNKVAVVNGIAYPTNVSYQYGFMSGVNYANKNYGTAAEIVELPSYAGVDVTGANVGGNYVGNFSDEETGKAVGKALLDQGVDIIFVAAGASGNGVFTAVKEADGAMVIGCDTDQYDDGANGSGNIVLTSSLKVMDTNVCAQLTNISTDNFEGKNAILGADSFSTGYVYTEGRCQLTDEMIQKIDEAFEKVSSGEVVPASSSNGMTPDNFTGL